MSQARTATPMAITYQSEPATGSRGRLADLNRLVLPLARGAIWSISAGKGRCRARALSAVALSHTSHSSGVVSRTGMALGERAEPRRSSHNQTVPGTVIAEAGVTS
jgi:hypothetical protein